MMDANRIAQILMDEDSDEEFGDSNDAEDSMVDEDDLDDDDDAAQQNQALIHAHPGNRNAMNGQPALVLPWVQQNNIPKVNNFTGIDDGVLQLDADVGHTPLDYWHLFVNDEFTLSLCNETNRYALQYFSTLPNNGDGSNIKKEWKETNLSEMEMFLALNFLMGIVDLPEIRMY